MQCAPFIGVLFVCPPVFKTPFETVTTNRVPANFSGRANPTFPRAGITRLGLGTNLKSYEAVLMVYWSA